MWRRLFEEALVSALQSVSFGVGVGKRVCCRETKLSSEPRLDLIRSGFGYSTVSAPFSFATFSSPWLQHSPYRNPAPGERGQ